MPTSTTPTDIDQMTGELSAALRRHLGPEEVTGLTWSIGIGDQVRSDAAGSFDPQPEGPGTRPVGTDAIFRISSMTKPITAAAAMALVDDGRIALEQPVDDLLPELAERQVLLRPDAALTDTEPSHRPVTIDDLLTFRVGIGMDFTDFRPTPLDEATAALGLGAGPPQPQQPPEPDEWIRRLGRLPLRYQPGERWLYHAGADILAVLIARAAGRPLDDWMRERLFDPLGMSDTGFAVPAENLDRFGDCFGIDQQGQRNVYDPAGGQWSNPPAFPGGGAGLVSTVGDFQRFADMLRGGGLFGGRRVLSAGSVEAMKTNRLTVEQLRHGGPDPTGNLGWGLGIGVQLRSDELASAGSYGWDGGLGSLWRTDPDRDLVAILMTDRMWTSPEPPPVCRTFLSMLARHVPVTTQ